MAVLGPPHPCPHRGDEHQHRERERERERERRATYAVIHFQANFSTRPPSSDSNSGGLT